MLLGPHGHGIGSAVPLQRSRKVAIHAFNALILLMRRVRILLKIKFRSWPWQRPIFLPRLQRQRVMARRNNLAREGGNADQRQQLVHERRGHRTQHCSNGARRRECPEHGASVVVGAAFLLPGVRWRKLEPIRTGATARSRKIVRSRRNRETCTPGHNRRRPGRAPAQVPKNSRRGRRNTTSFPPAGRRCPEAA